MTSIHGDHLTTRTAAPAVSPVSLVEAKLHLRVSGTDEDTLIQLYIDAATAAAEEELGKVLITQTWTETIEYPTGRVKLTKAPVQSVSAIQYYDGDNVSQAGVLSDYSIITQEHFAYIEPVSGGVWPTVYDRPDAMTFTYTAGYGDAGSDVAANIRQAIFLLVGQYYEHRVNVEETKFQEMPRAVTSLLGLSRAHWYG